MRVTCVRNTHLSNRHGRQERTKPGQPKRTLVEVLRRKASRYKRKHPGCKLPPALKNLMLALGLIAQA